jgi:dTDP-4-amino-4,6-dideoxygalactose transaminase
VSDPALKIRLMVPDLPRREEVAPYIDRIDASHWYTNFGPLVRELEAGIKASLQAQSPALPQLHVVSVNNATIGLELALLALALPAGSRVLMPALTFVASAAAALRANCIPVFCDVEPDTWLLSPRIAREAAKHVRFDAVMPVSTYGCPVDVAAWDTFSSETGIPVVVDAAGAWSNQHAGHRIILVYSLHATKALASAEGGMLVSADAGYIDRVRVLSNFGIDPLNVSETTAGSTGVVHSAGTNGKLSEYHAAIALAALAQWPASSARRIEMHKAYLALLADACPDVTPQRRAPDGVYWVLPVLLPEGRLAADAFSFLRGRGIETRRWYCPPLPAHPAFSGMPVAGGLACAGAIGERLIALPFHLLLSPADRETVTASLAEFLRAFR